MDIFQLDIPGWGFTSSVSWDMVLACMPWPRAPSFLKVSVMDEIDLMKEISPMSPLTMHSSHLLLNSALRMRTPGTILDSN